MNHDVKTISHTKKCTKCGKSDVKFGYRKEAKDKLNSQCNECRSSSKRAWHLVNKDKVKEWRKARYHKHSGEEIKYQANYFKERRKIDPLYKLTSNLRILIGQSFRKNGYSKKSTTRKLLGADYEIVRDHLISTAIKNYGSFDQNESYDIDHVVPCSSASNEEELLKLQYYTNLQYLKPSDNRKKRDSLSWTL